MTATTQTSSKFNKKDVPVTIPDATIMALGTDAILFKIDGEELWIPRSVILDSKFDTRTSTEIGEREDVGSIKIPGWFARKNHIETDPVFPNFGRNAGQPIAGAAAKDLEFYANVLRRSLADASKAQYHQANKTLLDAIVAEQRRNAPQ